MYIIGLIDDEESQLRMIRRTIKTNATSDEQYDFKSYLVSDNANDFVTDVFEEVIGDIKELKLSSLIVDYKIIVKTSKIKGTDIFKRIKEEVPKFPIIILTEVVEESTEPEFIDADKVYKKKDFYKIESEYSKEKVFNIFDSMRKYIDQRDRLQLTIDDLKQKLTEGSLGREAISSILALETQLDDFVPTEQSQIDKVFDKDKAKEIVALLEKANTLLG
ncbi:MAG: hypothetical protein NC311_06810 [Muribaculaceae bacterium]|nr:hypothetical protein [Muribaculaceae bacterium]MCM1399009.1 hypothetical protein [Clostridium sp.]MCM1458868.1 hypothetical protein [Bacteroides sp.]